MGKVLEVVQLQPGAEWYPRNLQHQQPIRASDTHLIKDAAGMPDMCSLTFHLDSRTAAQQFQ